ncbi:CHAT domain-containing protein [Cercophora newfieldiana]|uniref:CHAT domain-containing protein n=1 Tax=Cercophora newfieldiana TaxID=92897 RepID=A0AA40CMD6_9PEZI|nr:CHAT domain-containing protein [Cercophora newfieldiana]
MMELILAGATFATVLTVFVSNSVPEATAARENTTDTVIEIPNDVPRARHALSAVQQGDPNHVLYMHNLAVQLGRRYKSIGAAADFEEASQIARDVIRLSPPDHPHSATFLLNLACLLRYRHERVHRLADLDEAIRYTRESLQVPAIPKQRAQVLAHLSLSLEARFKKGGLLTDIEEAVQMARDALAIFTESDSEQLLCMSRLPLLLFAQSDVSGTADTLEEALIRGYEAIDKLPSTHQARGPILTRLATAHHAEYQATGDLWALETAIKLRNDAKDLTRPNSPESTTIYHFLGLAYLNRFETTNSTTDLDAAMRTASLAAYGTPYGHPEKSERLAGLGRVYHEKHTRSGAPEDLETATKMYQAALDISQKDGSNTASLLGLLGRAHLDRHHVGAPGSCLELAIRLCQEAVDLTLPTQPDRALHLEMLGRAYQAKSRYATADLADSTLTTLLFQEALDATPPKHPKRAARLRILALHNLDKYKSSGADSDLEYAAMLLGEALGETSSSTRIRLLAGKELTSLLTRRQHWQKAHETAHRIIHMMCSLPPTSLGLSDKKFILSELDGFASDAAAIALAAGKSAFEALELLELGRDISAGSLSALYADISLLSQKHPEVATRYTKARDEVDRRAKSTETQIRQGSPPGRRPGQIFTTKESEAERRHKADRELENIIAEIRRLSGFQDFLLPPSEPAIKAAAHQGPLITINISSYRCDAILATQDAIQVLPLPSLTKSDLETRLKLNNLADLNTLSWLWHIIASPILTTLNYTTHPATQSKWPRVWWLPTGALSRFPLHAAGIHTTTTTTTTNPPSSVLDLVMSSYTTTIKTLLHNRALPTTHHPPSPSKAILLAMPTTPGQAPLPHAQREIASLTSLLLHHLPGLSPVKPAPLKEALMSELASPCTIFHFAGHGRTDAFDALESYLCLGETTTTAGRWNRDEKLKVGDLWKLNLREGLGSAPPPFLAYLSACGTGVIGEEGAVQEGVHLVGAFQAVGFRHVVGTLWEVSDEVCVDVAVGMYEGMVEGGWGDEAVCRGLHRAVRAAREKWLRGRSGGGGGSGSGNEMRKVVLCDEEDEGEGGEEELHWVPYVHFGV